MMFVILLFAVLRWLFGTVVIVLIGLWAHSLGVAQPEAMLMWVFIAWSMWQLWVLLRMLRRYIGG